MVTIDFRGDWVATGRPIWEKVTSLFVLFVETSLFFPRKHSKGAECSMPVTPRYEVASAATVFHRGSSCKKCARRETGHTKTIFVSRDRVPFGQHQDGAVSADQNASRLWNEIARKTRREPPLFVTSSKSDQTVTRQF